MKIDRIDKLLQQFNKPAINLINHQINVAQNSVLIICAGFEDRAKEIFNRIKLQNSKMRVVIIDYLPLVENNSPGFYYDKCLLNNWDLIKLTYDRGNPVGFGNILLSKIGEDYNELIIDISGMSRLLIIQLIVALSQTKRHFNGVKIVYTEALEYPPSQQEVQAVIKEKREHPDSAALLVSSGVLELCVVPELSSISMQGQPIRLIAFPSFNTDQFDVVNVVQSAKTTLINGIPPYPELKWRLEAIRELNNLRFKDDYDELATSTLDYRETIDNIMNIYQEHGDLEKLILSPTGSKMQAVASGISRAFLTDLQIVYPAPGLFAGPSSYTIGVRQMWELNLMPFNQLLTTSI